LTFVAQAYILPLVLPCDARDCLAHSLGEALKVQNIAPNKLYYSISEVARIVEVKPYVLRFWEKEFPSLKPKKNRSGNRIYQEKEIELLLGIKRLLYEEGYTIEGARQQIKNNRKNRIKKAKSQDKNCLKNDLLAIKKEIESLIELLS
jgi:DNA-binding transcriptional MerR regulator